MLDKHLGYPFHQELWGIHLAGNQIARVAMFLHHARSPLLVVQEKLKTVNVGQAFGASILLGILDIHLAWGHPFGQEPDCESHISTPCKVISTSSLGKTSNIQCWTSVTY